MKRSPIWNISDPDFHDRVVERPFPSDVRASNCLFIFVHGFNTDGPSAVKNYTDFEVLLTAQKPRRQYDLVRLLWPSTPHGKGFRTSKALRPFWYASKVDTALRAADHVGAELARQLASRTAQTEIALVGHSLGCRLVLEALVRWWGQTPWKPHGPSVRTYLMGAAVDRQLLIEGQGLGLPEVSQPRHSVYYSGSDAVLWFTFPPGQSIAKDPRRLSRFPTALGFKGVKANTHHARNHRAHGFGHTEYWPKADMTAKDVATDLVAPTAARRAIATKAAGRRDLVAAAAPMPRRVMGGKDSRLILRA